MQRLPHPNEQDIELWIKRDDLIHPEVSGNKWRKLKYNFKYLADERYKGILTYGGAFSNHIHATASAANALSIPAVGIIRGERDEKNPSIRFAEECGMRLHFVSRGGYRNRDKGSLEIQAILEQYPDYMVVPEGGANDHAMHGVREIIDEINVQETGVTHIITAVGTGTTIAGLCTNENLSNGNLSIIGMPVLKYPKLDEDIHSKFDIPTSRFSLIHNYYFGGYGKWDKTLLAFVNLFYNQYQIQLDMVYTAKAMFGLFDLVGQGYFDAGSKIVFLHTGGLQGNIGFRYRWPSILLLED